LYDLGWPRVIKGRAELMQAFRRYGDYMALQSADNLVIHKADNGHTVIIEYEVHGAVVGSGRKYDNRFCSIVGITNRKISRWGDYMDSLAAWVALNKDS